MVDKSYEEICAELGFLAEVKFVEIYENGKIGFSCGKPNEIKSLWYAIREAGYLPSYKIKDDLGYNLY